MFLPMSHLLPSVSGWCALVVALSTTSTAQVRVAVMPGYPNAPNVLPGQRHLVRPGAPVAIWGNSNSGRGATPAGTTYRWSFSGATQNLQILTDGDLEGMVTDDRFIAEVVTFQLLNNSTRGTVSATLTVDAGAQGSAARTVQILVLGNDDPESDEPLERQQIDVNIAIQNGLRSLYLVADHSMTTTGQPIVTWPNPGASVGGTERGASAFALWAFQNQRHLPRPSAFDEDIYAEWVQMGLNRFFNESTVLTGTAAISAPRATMALGATADGVSDMNGNGRCIQLDASGVRGYSHSMICAAIVASTFPDQTVTLGPLSGSTYRSVVEDAVDWLGATQNVNNNAQGIGRGGWNYVPTSTGTRSDMSINSWAYVAMEGATDVFGVDVPDWICQEIEHGLVFHQAGDGRFGYVGTSMSTSNGLLATTGGGISGLSLVETATLYTPGAVIAGAPMLNTIQSKRNAALVWLGENWGEGNASALQGFGQGNQGNYYVMWTVARGLRLTAASIGLPPGENVALVNGGVTFDWETGEENGTGTLASPGSNREGYFTRLLLLQTTTGAVTAEAFGSWSGWYGRTMGTALAALVLTPRVFADTGAPATSYCFGIDCPCGNDSVVGGCANSLGQGATLVATGSASVSADDLVLTIAGVPPSFAYLFLSAQNTCVALGDGFLGVTPGPYQPGLLRFFVSTSVPGGEFNVGPGLIAYANGQLGAGNILLPGTTWFFQAAYRDGPLSPCQSFFNLTNAMFVTFQN